MEITVEKISHILTKYDTDKANGHHYGDAYDDILSNFDRIAPLNILEVGTQKGGSLLAWKEFFPNAKVSGIDIIDVVTDKNRSDTVNYIVSNVKNFVTEEMFDIIIDDGSHFIEDVLYVVKHLTRNLNKGGILVIEDVQDPLGWLLSVNSTISNGFKITTKDLRFINNQYDDFLIIITRI